MKLACACSHQHWFVGMLGLLVAVFLLDPCKMSKDYNMHDILCCRLHSTILNLTEWDMTLCCVWWFESYMVSRPTRKAMFCSVSVNPGVLNDQARTGQRVCPCGSLLCYLLLLCIEDIVSLHSSGAFDGRASRCSDSNMWVRQVWREYLRLEQVGRCCAVGGRSSSILTCLQLDLQLDNVRQPHHCEF